MYLADECSFNLYIRIYIHICMCGAREREITKQLDRLYCGMKKTNMQCNLVGKNNSECTSYTKFVLQGRLVVVATVAVCICSSATCLCNS